MCTELEQKLTTFFLEDLLEVNFLQGLEDDPDEVDAGVGGSMNRTRIDRD